MTRENLGILGDRRQALEEAFVHRIGVPVRQVRSPASIDKQRVTGEQKAVDEKALAPRGVPGRVDAGNRDPSEADDIAAFMEDTRRPFDARRRLHEGELAFLDVYGHVDCAQKFRDSRDRIPKKVSANVVRVVVGGEDSHEVHAGGVEDPHELIWCIRGVDEHRFASFAVADCIDEIRHPLREIARCSEVMTRAKLPEIAFEPTSIVRTCGVVFRLARFLHVVAPASDVFSGCHEARFARRTSFEKTSTMGKNSPSRR